MGYKMCLYCDKKLRRERATELISGRLRYRTYCPTKGCRYNLGF